MRLINKWGLMMMIASAGIMQPSLTTGDNFIAISLLFIGIALFIWFDEK